jgi:hypothetical protein
MTFDEDIRRLAPLIGKDHSKRLWRAYLMEDRDGQDDIHAWVRLNLEKRLGNDLLSAGQFLSLPTSNEADGRYYLGDVMQAGESDYAFGLRDHEMIQHMTIFGRSGAGKTNTVALLLKSLAKHKKPFLLFDWKQNYRDMLAEEGGIPLEIYTVGRNVRPLHFNPLIPPKGTLPQVWLKKLIEIACNAYYLGEGVSYLLQDAIHSSYEKYGVYSDAPVKRYPTMRDVLVELQEVKVKGRKAMWMDSALRALQTLCFGPISEVVNVDRNESLTDLLNQYAILELDALANAEKIFVIESLMVWIHHYRLTEREREVFKHCIIVEEAHNILNPTEKDDVVNTLMREIREFGESIVLVDQHPSQMSIPAMGNTHCTIALNVKHNRDIQALADAMQVLAKDRGLFGQLPMGQAVVKLQSRFVQPFLVKIPKVPLKKGTITDAFLHRHFAGSSSHSVESVAPQLPTVQSKPIPPTRTKVTVEESNQLNDIELCLMKDIMKYPLDGVVKRYSRLGISRRRGNAARESLIKRGALVAVPVTIKQGQTVLLGPSPEMKASLQRVSGMTFNPRDGGLTHQYWKMKLRRALEGHGWSVEEEKRLPDGHVVDLHAERGNLALAVEVEAGTRGLQNIQKVINAGYEIVLSFSSEGFRKAELLEQLSKEDIPMHQVFMATPVDWEVIIGKITERGENRKV